MMSARSAGVITRSPSMIRSRKCSSPIAPTISRPTSRCAPPSTAPSGLPTGCRYARVAAPARPPRPSARPAIGASGTAAATRSPDHPRQPGAHPVDRLGVHAGWPPPRSACSPRSRSVRDSLADGVEHLLDGPPWRPRDDQQHRRAEVVGGVDVEVELDGEATPAGEVAALDDHEVRGPPTSTAAVTAASAAAAIGVVADDRLRAGMAPPSATVR